MPPRPAIPTIETPDHHVGAMLLLFLTRAPDDDLLRDAARLVDHATTAAWALRPGDLATLTVEQYRQLLNYTGAPQLLDLALYLRGDKRRIRTLIDHITRAMADFLAHYPSPPTQG
ncbi:hypothetical protein [Streptomyces flavofungini]|uniref:hypothetical protein n=1 Tax=Streptomyces flavofungini TaxID=68200 RepID=UPI0025AF99C1|nr:hypothetical protein [Streptomyces flavofungini]WJV48935.1 hypothetical protein QUY26_27510 [Streptomyces flavofungini]